MNANGQRPPPQQTAKTEQKAPPKEDADTPAALKAKSKETGLAPQGKAATTIVKDQSEFSNLLDTSRFDHLWRVAIVFSRSAFVPAHFQGQPENCFVALQMAFRLRVDPLMLMQGIYLVKGKPGMEAKVAIALVNSRGPFTGPIQYAYKGAEGSDDRRCTAYATYKVTGEKCEATVTLVQAKAKGWYQSNENWRTLTDLMLAYRSATFLARLYAPETLMGMQTVDEVEETATRLRPSGEIDPEAEAKRLRTELDNVNGERPQNEKRDEHLVRDSTTTGQE